jgi:hypothetical protein
MSRKRFRKLIQARKASLGYDRAMIPIEKEEFTATGTDSN